MLDVGYVSLQAVCVSGNVLNDQMIDGWHMTDIADHRAVQASH